jgi:hypothetical protein
MPAVKLDLARIDKTMNTPNSRCRRWRLAGINGFLAGSGGAQLWETPLIRVICPIGNTCAM